MNKGDLIGNVADACETTKVQATLAVDTVLASIEKALKKGDKVTLIGFGTFQVSKRKARLGINPKTKEKIKIAAKKVVRFKAGSGLSDAVN